MQASWLGRSAARCVLRYILDSCLSGPADVFSFHSRGIRLYRHGDKTTLINTPPPPSPGGSSPGEGFTARCGWLRRHRVSLPSSPPLLLRKKSQVEGKIVNKKADS